MLITELSLGFVIELGSYLFYYLRVKRNVMEPARNRERRSPKDEFKWREEINIKLFYDYLLWVSVAQHRSYTDICASGQVWTPWLVSGMIIFAITLLPLYASYITALFIQKNIIQHGYHSHAKTVFKEGWLTVRVFRELFLPWRHKPSLSCLQNVILITTHLQLCFSVICITHVEFIYRLLS